MNEKRIKEIVKENIYSFLYLKNGENVLPEQTINEALIHSYDAGFVLRHLREKFSLASGIIEYFNFPEDYVGWIEKRKGKNDSDVILLALEKQHSNYLKVITLSMEKSCGWFLSTKINLMYENFEAWQFEKKFDNEVTQEVLTLKKIYHLFPSSRLQKVIHVGLLPKKTTWIPFMLDDEHSFEDENGIHYGWKTIDRVYFFKEKPSEEFLTNNNFSSKNIFTSTYKLLAIDTKKLLPNTKFYSDPRSKDAVYSLDNIPPSAIEILF